MNAMIPVNALRRLMVAGVVACVVGLPAAWAAEPSDAELNDAHFHLTNYIQEGTDIRDFLGMMGERVGRVAIFGIPRASIRERRSQSAARLL